MAAEAEAADAAQALGEGADDEVDLVEQAELFAQAQPARPEHAERMRLVDQQPGAVALLDLDDLAQRGVVAAGAVQALDHHQGAAGVGAEAGQAPVEVFGIVVAKADRGRVAQPAAVVDAGVAVGVDEQELALSGQAGQGAEVGLVAGREDDARGPAEGVGQGPLELAMAGVVAARHARAGGAGAAGLDRGDRRGAAFGVEGQAEVVVGAGEHRPLAADGRRGGRMDRVHRRRDRQAPRRSPQGSPGGRAAARTCRTGSRCAAAAQAEDAGA